MLHNLVWLLFVANAAAGVAAEGEWLDNGVETNETFVPYPPEIQRLFDDEVQSYANGVKIPVLRAFTAFPETVHNKMVWPLLKGLVRRMYPLMGPHAVFYMEDGLSFECRTDGERAITTDYCRNHCIRQGRYCVPEESTEESIQSHTGRDILQEILRRLCLVQHYHTKEMKVYDYMEQFHRRYCIDKPNITECSLDIMKEVGAHHSALRECLQEDMIDKDVASEVLDRNLGYLLDKNLDDLPQIELDEKPILIDEEWPFDSQSLLRHFCNSFDTLPLACQYCLPCQDVRTCLWKLTCDGAPPVFEVTNITLFPSSPPSSAEPNTTAPTMDAPVTDAPTTGAPTSAATPIRPPTQVAAAKAVNADPTTSSSSGGLDGLAILIIFLVVVVVSCPALFWIYRHFRSQQLMDEILATLPTEKYEPDEDIRQGIVCEEYANDFTPTYWKGQSCRPGKTPQQTLFIDHGISIVEPSRGRFPAPTSACSGTGSCQDEDSKDEDDIVTSKVDPEDDDRDVFVDEHLDVETASKDSPLGGWHRASAGRKENIRRNEVFVDEHLDVESASKDNHLGGWHRAESNGKSYPLSAGRKEKLRRKDVVADEPVDDESASKDNPLDGKHRGESNRKSLSARRKEELRGDLPYPLRREMQDANWNELMC